MLARHYYFANISRNYQTLGFDDIFEDRGHIESVVRDYIDKWPQNKRYGRGLIFIGPLGTGKTFAQILILKELIKRGERCWFLAFSSLVRQYVEERSDLLREMRQASCFSIDEVSYPVSSKQRDLYEEALEYVIRYRVENLLPTLIGSNLTTVGFQEQYPRVDSLMNSTSKYQEMLGADVRVAETRETIDSLIDLNEVRPIK